MHYHSKFITVADTHTQTYTTHTHTHAHTSAVKAVPLVDSESPHAPTVVLWRTSVCVCVCVCDLLCLYTADLFLYE